MSATSRRPLPQHRAVASLLAIGVVLTLSASAAGVVGPTRLAGADRYATAVAISKATFKTPPVPVVYIATGLNFPDALAGGPAAAREGGPVLLVRPDSIPDVVKAELTRLKPGQVRILGGTAVVSSAVSIALKAYTTGSVVRLAGSDRYATAATVVTSRFAGYTGRVFVAFGGNFPDALSGGAAAAAIGAPIVLARTADVPDSTLAALKGLTPTSFVLLGGSAVLGSAVVNELKAHYPGVPVSRWSGPDRYATSAAIAANAFPGGADTVFLATGANFPDALAGVPAAASAAAPILLAKKTCLPPAVFNRLQALAPANVVLLGGTGVLADSVTSLVCGSSPPSVDRDGPVLSDATVNPSYIYFGDSSCGPMSSTVSVRASDPSVVSSVTLKYRPPDQATRSAAMTRGTGDTWTATVTTDASWQRGYVDYWFEAQDRLGNPSSFHPQGDQYLLFVEECNPPPVVTIVQPANGTVLKFSTCSSGYMYVDVNLQASVKDNGPIPSGAIVWTDSTGPGETRLGTGATLPVRLYATVCTMPGTAHLLTVTVTDAGGLTAKASATVYVQWAGPT